MEISSTLYKTHQQNTTDNSINEKKLSGLLIRHQKEESPSL